MQILSVEFSGVSDLGLLLTKRVNGMCSEEMVKLRELVELPVVESDRVLTALRLFCIFIQHDM